MGNARAVILFGGLLLWPLVAGCKRAWPEENVRVFKRSCLSSAKAKTPQAEDGALISYCNCAADRVQARYTLEEVTKVETLMLADPNTGREIAKAFSDCSSALRPADRSAARPPG